VILTGFLVFTMLGATALEAPVGFAGIAIGLVLVLIHLVGIPVTNTSVNPARSIGPAVFVGGWALSQFWLFIVRCSSVRHYPPPSIAACRCPRPR
jgi:aquaporin Z